MTYGELRFFLPLRGIFSNLNTGYSGLHFFCGESLQL